MAPPPTWIDLVTLGLALLGAVLGVMNTWQAINAGRVRLRVKPAHAIASGGQHMFSIEVVNLSDFALTITEVGFTIGGSTIKTRRAAVPRPVILDGGPWPRRLESREAVSLHLDPGDLVGTAIGRAYARTASGEVGYGTSPAVKQLREMVA